jgi:DNA-binding transcriptional ArsR family regulator
MYRKIAAQELAKFLGAIAHPDRIRIIEELQEKELDVSTLQARLGLAQASVSRHLGVLKTQRVVQERKAGRQVFYHLLAPILSQWLIEGLNILENQSREETSLSKAFRSAKKLWSAHS